MFWKEIESYKRVFEFFHTDEKGEHLHLESRAFQDRKILGGLVQGSVCPLSHHPCAKTAPSRRFDLFFFFFFFSQISSSLNRTHTLTAQFHA